MYLMLVSLCRTTPRRWRVREGAVVTPSPRPLPGGSSRAVRVWVSTRSETSRAHSSAARAPRGSPPHRSTQPDRRRDPCRVASMGLADVIQPATSTAYDEEAEDYGLWATLACILAGAVFTFLFLAGGQERQEQTQQSRDAEDDDARTNLLRACTRVLSWEADSDDEQESRAFATALDDALKRARSVHDGLSTMPTPPSDDAMLSLRRLGAFGALASGCGLDGAGAGLISEATGSIPAARASAARKAAALLSSTGGPLAFFRTAGFLAGAARFFSMSR